MTLQMAESLAARDEIFQQLPLEPVGDTGKITLSELPASDIAGFVWFSLYLVFLGEHLYSVFFCMYHKAVSPSCLHLRFHLLPHSDATAHTSPNLLHLIQS
jgi:hypothetical protein